MSGRIRQGFAASFGRPRFVGPVVVAIFVLAVIVWMLRGRV